MRDIEALLIRFNKMKGTRATTEAYWQEISDYMIPSREFTRRSVPGSRRTQALIYNTTPVLALEQLAGALHGMLTNTSLRWFSLRASEQLLMENDDIRGWFEAATDAMYGVFTNPEAGFDVALHEVYLDLSAYGNGVIYIPDTGMSGPRFEARPLAEVFVEQNARSVIDTVFRLYPLRRADVVLEWPDAVPGDFMRAAEKNPDDKVDVLHCVVPVDGRWQETYMLPREKIALAEAEYQSFPFAVPRWSKRSGETWGYGPGANALPDVKLLNKLEEINLRSAAKMLDPPLMVPDDGFLDEVVTTPGGLNYFRSGTPNLDKIGPLNTGGRPELGDRMVDTIQNRVRRVFYIDWMNLPQQPNMTATEVLQRRDEMLRLLGPMVARVTAELLGPLIKRTFYVMARNEMLPPAPPALKGQAYTVEYLSPLATAQKANDAETVMRWLTAMTQIAQIDPGVTAVINTDATARFLASRYGAPAIVVRAQAEVDALRQQQAQQAEQQHEAAMATAAATTAHKGASAINQFSQALAPPANGPPNPANGPPGGIPPSTAPTVAPGTAAAA